MVMAQYTLKLMKNSFDNIVIPFTVGAVIPKTAEFSCRNGRNACNHRKFLFSIQFDKSNTELLLLVDLTRSFRGISCIEAINTCLPTIQQCITHVEELSKPPSSQISSIMSKLYIGIFRYVTIGSTHQSLMAAMIDFMAQPGYDVRMRDFLCKGYYHVVRPNSLK